MYDNGHSTLFDFSVAAKYSPGDRLRDNAGTVEYMASEQTHREHLAHATDVFGLGVLFCQLLTGGKLPYPVVRREDPDEEGETVRELDYDTPPAHPSTHNPGVPKALGDVALAAIRPDMAERYATPGDFREALSRAVEETGL